MGYFIPLNKIKNLKLYKYQSEDHSYVSKFILKRWWNYFVQIFPSTMAPNVITLLGLAFIIINLTMVLYFDPYLNTPAPRWCYFAYAFGLFMYQTFDGCDGCHARNTGQSGPLGELFDHSIDAINTTLASIIFSSVFQFGYGYLFLLTQFASVTNFYLSTWEEYHTHKLFLSQFLGPVEGILMIIVVYILTGIFGPEMFLIKLLSITSWNFVIDVKLAASVLGLGSLYFNIAQTYTNVAKHYKKIGTPERTSEAIQGILPFITYYVTIIALTTTFPEYLYQFAVPLTLSIGLSIAFSVGRIILAHLTVQEFPMIQFPMFVPLLQLILTTFATKILNYDYFDTIYSIAWLGFGVTLGIHAMFINEIIYEITTYLDIYALSIKNKKE